MKKPIKTEIDCTCGIWDTTLTIRDYGDKIVVTNPYVKWVNNNGNLSFEKTTLTSEKALKAVRDMAENGRLWTDLVGDLTIDDVIRMYK